MKFIVRNTVSRNITLLNILSCWSAAHPRMIFILTLQSFPRGGVLNVNHLRFPPLLQGGQAVISYAPLGRLSKLAPFRCFFAQVECFSVANLEESEKLWDAKGCHTRGSPFSCETPPHFSPDVHILKTLKCKCPHGSDWLWWGYVYIWTLWAWGCREDRWVDSLPIEVGVQPSGCSWCSIVLAGRLLPACLETNPSTWRLRNVALPLCPRLPCGSPEITESTNHC